MDGRQVIGVTNPSMTAPTLLNTALPSHAATANSDDPTIAGSSSPAVGYTTTTTKTTTTTITTTTATSGTTGLQSSQYRLLIPEVTTDASQTQTQTQTQTHKQTPTPDPLMICFHGSGEAACSPAWDALAALLLARGRRVLLCDRGLANPGPGEAAGALREYLRGGASAGDADARRRGPYVLVAHSYGGAFARTFLRRLEGGENVHRGRGRGRGRGGGKGGGRGGDGDGDGEGGRMEIAGMVLVETGQEGGLEPGLDGAQLRGRALGRRPLAVVRGNSLIGKWAALEGAEEEARARAGNDGEEGGLLRTRLDSQREMLRACDAEDKRLKVRQLRLASEGWAAFVEIADCGHHVVRDRPGAVAEAVEWVVGRMGERGVRVGGAGW